MGQAKDESEKTTGPWDVIMHLVKSFPVVAVAAALIFGVVYVVRELARVQANTTDQVIAAQKQVAEADKEASKMMQERLETSNNLLLDVATKIQVLVSGQVANMEQMDKLRIALAEQAAELQRKTEATQKEKLAEYELQRAELQKQVGELKSEQELQIIRSTVERVRQALQTGNTFAAFEVARNAFEAFQPSKALEIQELERLAKTAPPKEWQLQLILLHALSRFDSNDRRDEDLAVFFNAHLAKLGRNELQYVLDQFRLNEAQYSRRMPLVMLILNDAKRDWREKIPALEYLTWRRLIEGDLMISRFPVKEDFFQVMRLLQSILTDAVGKTSSHEKEIALRAAENLEPAAFHVWSDDFIARNDDVFLVASVKQSRELLATTIPLFKDPASEDLRRLWNEPNLSGVSERYPKEGTLPAYRPSL